MFCRNSKEASERGEEWKKGLGRKVWMKSWGGLGWSPLRCLSGLCLHPVDTVSVSGN